MKRVYIYCEGQTEEIFVNEILYPYFINVGIAVSPIICTTKRTPTKKYKGGVADYKKIKKELTILCKQHRHEYVTTMFDYYAMPENTPGIDCNSPDLDERILAIEETINNDIGAGNCRFHFMVHEFEGLLFSDPSSFMAIADESVVNRIQDIRDNFPSPEHINRSPETAPSKRIKEIIPGYSKVRNGSILAKQIGIDTMMNECSHFRNWINEIIAVASED